MADQSLCSIPNCGKTVIAKGFCDAHYRRHKRHGDPLGGNTQRGSIPSFVKGIMSHDSDECLMWPFSPTPKGYGRIKANGNNIYAHHYVCTLAHGPAPEGLEAAHSCGKRLCVNPNHLSWKTPAGNQADRLIHGTHARGTKNTQAKLTESQIIEIRALKGTEPPKETAKRYSVSDSLVSMIQRRKRWNWLPD